MESRRILGFFLAISVSSIFCFCKQEAGDNYISSSDMSDHEGIDSHDMSVYGPPVHMNSVQTNIAIAYKNKLFSTIKNYANSLSLRLRSLSPRIKKIVVAAGSIPAAGLSLYVANIGSTYYFNSIEQTYGPGVTFTGMNVPIMDDMGVYITDLEDFHMDAVGVSTEDVICTYLVAGSIGLSVFAAFLAGMQVLMGII